MLGPAPNNQGGISTVLKTYQHAGLFSQWPIKLLITTFTDRTVFQKAIQGIRCLIDFLSLALKGRVSLVHAHMATGVSFWRKSVFLWIAYFAKIPTLLHLHGGAFLSFYQDSNPITKWYIRQLYAKMSVVGVLSEQWEKDINQIVQNTNIKIIYNPASIFPDHSEINPALHIPQRFLFLGRLDEKKGVDDLLQAFLRLKSQYPDMTLCCAGHGDTPKYKKIVHAMGLDKQIILPGWLDDQKKMQELKTASYFVLPSYFEGVPMCILEAMSYQLPVISTRVGGTPDLIESDVDGLLIQAGDIDALTSAMKQLLDNPEYASQLGIAARKKIESQFKADQVLQNLGEIYNSMINK